MLYLKFSDFFFLYRKLQIHKEEHYLILISESFLFSNYVCLVPLNIMFPPLLVQVNLDAYTEWLPL